MKFVWPLWHLALVAMALSATHSAYSAPKTVLVPESMQSIDIEVRAVDSKGAQWVRKISAGETSFELPGTLVEPIKLQWRPRVGSIGECSHSFEDELLRLQCEARSRASKMTNLFEDFPVATPAIKPVEAPKLVETQESSARAAALAEARKQRLEALRQARAAKLAQEREKQAQKAQLAAELARERSRLAGLARDRESALKAMKRGFQNLSQRRYDLSLNEFLRASAVRSLLGGVDQSALSFGLGVSSFHQKGCATARPELVKAQVVPKYEPDASYYLALCDVEEQKYKTAEAKFRRFVLDRHPDYSEASRFYLGVIADSRDDFDTASSAYQDTIDFADNAQLVELAKNRLAALKNREADSIALRQAVTLFVSLSTAWDSNVVGLPRGLSPSDYGVDGASALNSSALLSMDVKNPWMKSWDQRLRASALGLKYFDESLSTNFDAATLDAALNMSRTTQSGQLWSFAAAWNRVLLNAWQSPSVLLENYSLDSSWLLPLNRGGKKDWDLSQGLKASWTKNLDESTDGTTSDSTGPSLRYNARLIVKSFAPSSLGPSATFDWKRASGTESRYWSLAAGGFWMWPIGGADANWILNNDLGVKWTQYPTSLASRSDWELNHALTLVRSFTTRFEARASWTTIFNISNSDLYDFTRYQANFGLSYIF
jgi:tetratricopeptide (TPR) repeat protein